MTMLATFVMLAIEILSGCGGREVAPRPDPASAFLAGKIVNVLEAGDRTQIWIDRGPGDGVAVGDRVRLPCRDDLGTVSKAFGKRSVVEFATGPLPDSREVRVGRAGVVPEPWCDKPPPSAPPPSTTP